MRLARKRARKHVGHVTQTVTYMMMMMIDRAHSCTVYGYTPCRALQTRTSVRHDRIDGRLRERAPQWGQAALHQHLSELIWVLHALCGQGPGLGFRLEGFGVKFQTKASCTAYLVSPRPVMSTHVRQGTSGMTHAHAHNTHTHTHTHTTNAHCLLFPHLLCPPAQQLLRLCCSHPALLHLLCGDDDHV
jgi:hypothetical protein